VVPAVLTADQYFWGAVVQSKGVGKVTRQQATKISPHTLAQELEVMLTSLQRYRSKARALAQQMQAHGGCAAAVEFVKGLLE
jgi:UDP:flavonoid glycosyltransferase YjiC (YdhE family)